MIYTELTKRLDYIDRILDRIDTFSRIGYAAYHILKREGYIVVADSQIETDISVTSLELVLNGHGRLVKPRI